MLLESGGVRFTDGELKGMLNGGRGLAVYMKFATTYSTVCLFVTAGKLPAMLWLGWSIQSPTRHGRGWAVSPELCPHWRASLKRVLFYCDGSACLAAPEMWGLMPYCAAFVNRVYWPATATSDCIIPDPISCLDAEQVLKEWQKRTKNDAAVRLASVLHQVSI